MNCSGRCLLQQRVEILELQELALEFWNQHTRHFVVENMANRGFYCSVIHKICVHWRWWTHGYAPTPPRFSCCWRVFIWEQWLGGSRFWSVYAVYEHFRKVRFYPDLGGVHALRDVRWRCHLAGQWLAKQWLSSGQTCYHGELCDR